MTTQTDNTIKIQVHKRVFSGVVVARSGEKSIRVRVERMREHAKYKKKYKVSRMFVVHDEKNQYQSGDVVSFVECRPLSKSKRWRVVYGSK